MVYTDDNVETEPYDFFGRLHELFSNMDIADKPTLTQRAIELQVFLVSLYYPRLTNLEFTRKGPAPAADMIGVARRHAAVKLYEHFSSLIPTKRDTHVAGNMSTSKTVAKGLGFRFKRTQLLKNYLGLESGGLSKLLEDPSPGEYATLRAVSAVIRTRTGTGR